VGTNIKTDVLGAKKFVNFIFVNETLHISKCCVFLEVQNKSFPKHLTLIYLFIYLFISN
jgi:hypothetical protein